MLHRIERKQPNSRMCLVCGMNNPIGVKAFFYETDREEVIALFTPGEEYQGYPGRLHGGITSGLLDETIGRVIMTRHDADIWYVTLELKTRFRKPIPLGEELRIIGRITREGTHIFEGTGEVVLPSGEIAATGEGKYIRLPPEKIPDFDTEIEEWKVTASQDDPDTIEM